MGIYSDATARVRCLYWVPDQEVTRRVPIALLSAIHEAQPLLGEAGADDVPAPPADLEVFVRTSERWPGQGDEYVRVPFETETHLNAVVG
jgi:hypothetical protein